MGAGMIGPGVMGAGMVGAGMMCTGIANQYQLALHRERMVRRDLLLQAEADRQKAEENRQRLLSMARYMPYM